MIKNIANFVFLDNSTFYHKCDPQYDYEEISLSEKFDAERGEDRTILNIKKGKAVLEMSNPTLGVATVHYDRDGMPGQVEFDLSKQTQDKTTAEKMERLFKGNLEMVKKYKDLSLMDVKKGLLEKGEGMSIIQKQQQRQKLVS